LTDEPNQLLGKIAWSILFGCDIEDIPDPNKPENVPYIKAVRKAETEKLKLFMETTGKVLFDHLQTDVREGMFDIILRENTGGCPCGLSRKVDAIRAIVKLIARLETIANENILKGKDDGR